MKSVQTGGALGCNLGNKFLRRHSKRFGLEHDRRAMGIIGPDKVHLMPAHALKTNPQVGLDVFHDVADMERAIGIGQGGRDKQSAGRGGHGSML